MVILFLTNGPISPTDSLGSAYPVSVLGLAGTWLQSGPGDARRLGDSTGSSLTSGLIPGE